MDGMARRGVRPLRLVHQRAHNRRPGMQPQVNRHTVRLPTDHLGRTQALAQFEGRQHRPSGMVLLRHRRPEQRQKALA